MALPTLAQHVQFDFASGTSNSGQYTSNTTTGSILCAFVISATGGTITSVSDDQNGTWTRSSSNTTGDFGGEVAWFTFTGSKGGVKPNVTVVTSNATSAVWLMEWTNVTAVGPVAQSSSTTGTTCTSGSVTTTGPCAVMGGWDYGGNFSTVTGGYATVDSPDTHNNAVVQQVFASGTTTNPSTTEVSGVGWDGATLSLLWTPPASVSYPERFPPGPTRTQLEPAAFIPPPVVASHLTDAAPKRAYTSYPDRIDRPASNLRSEYFVPPPPVVAAHLSDAAPIGAKTSYPERVLAPARPPSDWGVTRNLLPITAVAAPTQFPTSYPERVDRAPTNISRDWAPSGFAGSVDDAGVDFIYPDRIDRPLPRDPGLWTTVGVPERTQVYVDQDFPDRVLGARPVSQQQDAASRPLPPERTSTYLDQDFPDRVLRAQAVAQQQDAAMRPLAPERTLPYLDQDFPDRVPGPRMPTPDAVTTVRAPEQTITRAPTSYPDTALRARSAPDYTTTVGQSEAPLPEPRTWYPERIDRPRSAPDAVTEAGNPIPNAAAPTTAYTSYPERFPRLGGLSTANQQDAASRNLVPIVYVRNWDLTSYPVTVPAAQRAAQFLDATEINPLPRPNAPAPTEGYASYPDRVPGPQPVAWQQDAASRPLAPESKLATPYTSYPERALGAPFPTTEQQHVAALPAKPEAPLPNDWYASFPDIVRGRALPTSQQQDQAARPLAPELPLPGDWRTAYPDIVRGPLQSQQQAFAGPVLPPPPPVVPLLVSISYPNMVNRPPWWVSVQWSATEAMLVIVNPPPPAPFLIPTSTSSAALPTSSSYPGAIPS